MKFTLRDLLWLLAFMAIALGWYVDHRAQSIRFRDNQQYWNRSTSYILQGYQKVRAENEAMKQAAQQVATQP